MRAHELLKEARERCFLTDAGADPEKLDFIRRVDHFLGRRTNRQLRRYGCDAVEGSDGKRFVFHCYERPPKFELFKYTTYEEIPFTVVGNRAGDWTLELDEPCCPTWGMVVIITEDHSSDAPSD